MKILKFGGASVKDAQGVKNLTKVLEVTGTQKTLIVISAMGKTTNSLEIVIDNYFNAKHKLQSSIQEIKKYHSSNTKKIGFKSSKQSNKKNIITQWEKDNTLDC